MVTFVFTCWRSTFETNEAEVSMKKVFQTISKNLLENTYAAFAGLRPVNLSKTTLAQVSSCKFCKVFKETFF